MELHFGILALTFVFVAGDSTQVTNIGLGKNATQTDTEHDGEASRAVDGNTNQFWSSSSCTHTFTKVNAYWSVDLGQNYVIDHVKVYKRMDPCCSEKLSDISLYTGVSETDYQLHATNTGVVPTTYTFQLTPKVIARYVKIQSPETATDGFVLCEVEVMGYEIQKAKYTLIPNVKGTGNVVKTTVIRAKEECCVLCNRSSDCFSVNINKMTLTCELLDSGGVASNIDCNLLHYSLL